ncbi:glucose 1-dehydrogenase [Clostridium formicaceticum]|uniref:Diacetyl reductase n=1 Tax=Clostridium formicaceticum TaxID=1497 RepID=A0AAC9RQA8_9CLOT|nr:glucose 1-dehydrogenase [Clostridium formicaceticum]AOY74636.1 diacetyl reductase [Clostridium formicaceticum]ARE89003.1 Diacetyl reductase [Clostridium formicaceticum]
MRLKEKIAIVTGAGRGIGRAIALRLAQEGATVVINDINKENLYKVKEEIQQLGQKTTAIVGDVSNPVDVDGIVNQTVKAYGKLDIMVANAGIASVKFSVEMTPEEWDKIFAVNCRGVFLCDTAAAKQMMKQKSGKIINCASIAAHSGFNLLAAYSASKFAVRGFTQALAKELGPHGIQVNAYCPGIVGTDMWDLIDAKMGPYLGMAKGEVLKEYTKLITLGRVQTPEDAACFVAYVASSDADYMTGQSVMIDGGVVMS